MSRGEKGSLTTIVPSGPIASHKGACSPCFLLRDAIGLPGGVGADAPLKLSGGGGGEMELAGVEGAEGQMELPSAPLPPAAS